jgi:hypothetical protein
MQIIPLSSDPLQKVEGFPLECLPPSIAASIRDVCKAQSLPIQYVASGCIWAVSTLAGRRYWSDFNGKGKNILYILWAGPVSMGKTPSFRVTCEEPLTEAYKYAQAEYDRAMAEYLQSKSSKDKHGHLPHPQHYIPITKEGTTEGLIFKHQHQPGGIGVYYDEAETIFSAGNYKSTNDAITFFTMAFAGDRFQQVRADVEKERVIPQLNINLLMGTQTERMGNVFTQDRIASGFMARFLMVKAEYQMLNIEIDPFGTTQKMCKDWTDILETLFFGALKNEIPIFINIMDSGKDAYRKYNRELMAEANGRILSKAESYIIGAEAKLSAYLPRLAQVLAIMNNPQNPYIDAQVMHDAFKLYRYFQASSMDAIMGMKTEIDTGLPAELQNLYDLLPEHFTSMEAKDICTRLGLNPRRFEVSIRNKDFERLFKKTGRGTYAKS